MLKENKQRPKLPRPCVICGDYFIPKIGTKRVKLCGPCWYKSHFTKKDIENQKIKKGDIFSLGIRGVGSNGDFYFLKGKFPIFLKNPLPIRKRDIGTREIGSVPASSLIKIRITKMFDTCAYAERV